jgi:hypothetical protein
VLELMTFNPFLPNGMQDAITSRSQNTRNILFAMLIFTVLVVGFFIIKWYMAILIAAGTVFIITPILQDRRACRELTYNINYNNSSNVSLYFS